MNTTTATDQTAARIATLVVHRRSVVHLPAHGFTSHPLQRAFLTKRRATRLAIPAPLCARRALSRQPVRITAPDHTQPVRGFDWSSLSSIAVMVTIVLVAALITGIRL